jgi:hypothetical protein
LLSTRPYLDHQNEKITANAAIFCEGVWSQVSQRSRSNSPAPVFREFELIGLYQRANAFRTQYLTNFLAFLVNRYRLQIRAEGSPGGLFRPGTIAAERRRLPTTCALCHLKSVLSLQRSYKQDCTKMIAI